MGRSVVVLLICGLIPLAVPVTARNAAIAAACQTAESSPGGAGKRSPNASRSIKFEQGNMGEIDTADGIHLGFTNFKASDGVNLRVLYWDFGDENHAAEALEKQIARADKVVERTPKRNSDGKVVGERVQVVLPPVNHREPLSAVFWTDGVSYHEIRSLSLKDILELERVYKY
jgi:hypothetical protein